MSLDARVVNYWYYKSQFEHINKMRTSDWRLIDINIFIFGWHFQTNHILK